MQANLEKRGKGDPNYRVKARNRLRKYDKRLAEHEATMEDIISGRSSGNVAASGTPVADAAANARVRWGDEVRAEAVMGKNATGGKTKKKKRSVTGAGAEDGAVCPEDGSEDDMRALEEVRRDMHRIADELAEVRPLAVPAGSPSPHARTIAFHKSAHAAADVCVIVVKAAGVLKLAHAFSCVHATCVLALRRDIRRPG